MASPKKKPVRPPSPGNLALLSNKGLAVTLRKSGMTYQEIGDTIGQTKQTAFNLVASAMREMQDGLQEAVTEHRQLQMERLNSMLVGYWPRRHDPKYGAMILGIMQRQDQLLGMVVEKVELNVRQERLTKMSDEELDAYLAEKTGAVKV